MNYSRDENIKRKHKQKSKKKKVKNKIGIIIFRVVLALSLVLMFAGAGAALGAYMGILENAPVLAVEAIQPDVYTTYFYDTEGNIIDRYKGEENREYVSYANIPQNLKNAFVAIEDERFFSHDGVDYRGMLRSLYSNFFTDNDQQGASTLTQQLIKNILKITRNTLETKLQEQYLAVEYEKKLTEQYNGSKLATKEHILEAYLNTAFLGHGLNGVKTAAKYYFDKEPMELTLSECAVIAAITQFPTNYSPVFYPEKNRKRQMMVLDRMLKLNMITTKEYDEAVADEAVYERISQAEIVTSEQSYVHDFFSDAVFQAVSEDLQAKFDLTEKEANRRIFTYGYQVHTTKDVNMQKILDEAFASDEFFPAKDYEIAVSYTLSVKNSVTGKTTHHLPEKGTLKKMEEVDAFVKAAKDKLLTTNDEILGERTETIPQPQAAMAIIDYHTGEVKAIAGGRGEKTGDLTFNRATDAMRSPGSVFKVVASYLPALDMGLITPATVIDDAPYTINDYSPRNWYTTGFKGLSTVRDGITRSMNVLAVKNLMNTGIDNSYDYLINLGFTTLVDKKEINGKISSDKVPALALGGITYGVTPVESAAAYGAIANQGEYNKPVFYTKVLDHDGNIILENIVEPKTVIKKTTAYLLTDMMKDVVTGTGGTGGKARFKNTKMPIAGKTGTSSDTNDLSFVGYTPYYVASVWLGFDKLKEIKDDNGYHLQLWSHVMERIHEGLPYKDFEVPEGIITRSVCKVSGKLPVEGLCDSDPRGSMVRSEKFAAGTEPTGKCDVHKSAVVDTSTGMLVSTYCPDDVIGTVIGIVRPVPLSDGTVTEDSKYELPTETCTQHSSSGLIMPPANGDGLLTPPDSGYYNQEQGPIYTDNPVGLEDSFIMTPSPVMPQENRSVPPVSPMNPGVVPTMPPTPTPIPDYIQPTADTSPVMTNEPAPAQTPGFGRPAN